MQEAPETALSTVRERLLDAARRCFLSDEYHAVSTRQIAELAQTNVSMIRYYFGNKEGLYEEMIRETYSPVLDLLDTEMMASTQGYAGLLRASYQALIKNPEFPKLILKVLALNQGPGRRFILQLLERGRTRTRQSIEAMKSTGEVEDDVDADMVRMLFVSLAMTPMLLKSIFEEQLERKLDGDFLDQLAQLGGRLFAAGLSPARRDTENDKGRS
ncbi:MAG TPA: TetR/AcrR family transcriptional regulator [Gammaproteobacteria bacterium]